MIPRADIIEWRSRGHKWKTDAMVEQDLLISRMMVELFSDPVVRKSVVFRGGTALHKLFLEEPLRYSEDIDLVQREAGPIGPLFDSLRTLFEGWLGDQPRRTQGPGVVNLIYRMDSEDSPPTPLRIKIEINSREHFNVLPLETRSYSVQSRWFTNSANISVYAIEELMATKLRALYQRRKGRDLFDLWLALQLESFDAAETVRLFHHYMDFEDRSVSQADYRQNLENKMKHPGFLGDIGPLIAGGVDFDHATAFDQVCREFVERMGAA